MINSKRKRVQGFTIDGTTSKDLDDALWIETYGNVGLIQIHIADPTELIELDSVIENEARSKLFTRYLRVGNIPMIPAEFSEDKCSLMPLQERNTLTVEARVDQTGVILDYSIYESTLVSLNKFSYDQVEDILYEKKATGFYLQLKMAEVWKDILACKRQELGAIGALQRKGFFTDEEGKIIGDYSRAQSIIAEFAILANTLVAQWVKEQYLPVIYRNHQPIARDTNSLRIHMNNLTISKEERAKYYHQLGKAKYSTNNQGHFALALPGYLHFTSPLRRFADFVNHRMIKACLRQEPVPYDIKTLEHIASRINQTVEKAASDTSERYKQKFNKQVNLASDYHSFNDKELFNIIRSKNYHQELLEATMIDRINKKILKERCTVAGLFLTDSKTIATGIANQITDDEIIYILNLADSLLDPLQLQYLELENTQEQKKIEANLVFEEIEIKAIGIGLNKKTAKLESAKLCLAKWVDRFNDSTVVSRELNQADRGDALVN